MEAILFEKYLSSFIFIGGLTLLFHTFKDFGSGKIDTRSNFLMKGLGVGLMIVGGVPLWYFLILMVGVFIASRIFKFLKSGDYSTFTWILILGFFFPLHTIALFVLFLLQYAIISILRLGLVKLGLKLNTSFPAHLIILTSYFAISYNILGF